VLKLYDKLVNALAWIAGFLLFAMMVSITIDVVLRNLGSQSSSHLFTFTEYALLLVPLLGSPWLVRDKGHVFVEIVTTNLPHGLRQGLARATCLMCALICAVLAYYGGVITWDDFHQASKDVRSFDMPRWMLTIFFPICFSMMALEFLRFFVLRENYLESAVEHVLHDAAP
jgi:C4-dicarboxylate transporter, DctQ subunit